MHVDAMKLFCDVAAHRSVSRAAEANGITQSAVSQRIMAIEKELGVQLIDRSRRPLQLTAAGDVYYHGSRKILSQYARLCQQIATADAALSGDVTVAAIYSAGIDLLNAVQAEFEADHPRTHVLINYLQPEAVCERVRRGLSDFGIVAFPQHWRDLASIPLRDELMVLVCHPDGDLTDRSTIQAGELADRPLVMFDSLLPIRRRITTYLKSHGVVPNIAASFDNIDTIKTYVAATPNVAAILPQRTVQREVRRGILAQVTLGPRLTRPLAAVYDRNRPMRALTRSFVDYLKTQQSSAEAPAEAVEAGR